MTRQRDCAACPLFKTCPYPSIFAPPPLEHRIQHFRQPPAPYLIEPEGWGARVLERGDPLRFGMTLMGRAERETALIVEALKSAASHGFGASGGTAKLEEVLYLPLAKDGKAIRLYRPAQDARLRDVAPCQWTAPPAPATLTGLTLRFRTPLRLQENGRALPPAKLTPATLLIAAVKRVALLAELYGSGVPNWDFKLLAETAATITGEKDLRWLDWSRYSSRQKQLMQLGGVLGTWRLAGDLTAFYPALFPGQWLGVGKETVFGLGRYEIVDDAV
jgi:hypothetical protein